MVANSSIRVIAGATSVVNIEFWVNQPRQIAKMTTTAVTPYAAYRSVSYTHLDVYKRQAILWFSARLEAPLRQTPVHGLAAMPPRGLG